MLNKEKIREFKSFLGMNTQSSYEELVCAVCFSFLNVTKRSLKKDFPKGTITRCKELLNYYISKRAIEEFNERLNSFTISEIKELVYVAYDDYEFDRAYEPSISTDLCELSYKLMKIVNGDFVYQPYCGIGKFLVYLGYKHKNEMFFKDLVGSTINKDSSLIAQMATYIMSCDIDGNNCAIFTKEPLSELPYPYVSAFIAPPLNLRIEDKSYTSKIFNGYNFSYRNTSEWLYIDHVLSNTLRYGNRAVGIVSARALFNKADQEYRDFLVSNGLIEGIIELPTGIVSNVFAKTYLIVFGKNCKSIKFIEEKEFNITKKGKTLHFNAKEIFDKFKSNNCKAIENEKLVGEMSLQPSAVIIKNENSVDGIPLFELADGLVGCQYTLGVFEKKNLLADKETDFKIITSSDIEKDYIDWKSLKSIKEIDKKFEKYVVHKDDLIITSKSSKVKIAVVDKEPKYKTMVTGGMIIVHPKTDLLNATYLKIYLDSEIGQNQLKAIQKGNIILTISVEDLLNLKIPTANIKEQNSIADRYNEILSTLVALKEEVRRVEEKLRTLFFSKKEVR